MSANHDSDAQICKTLLNRECDQGAKEQKKEGWERTEDKHLESPPACLTLSASGQVANVKEKKAKSGACFQERELLPTLEVVRGSCCWLQAFTRPGTTRALLEPLHVFFCLLNIQNAKTPYFSSVQAWQIKLAIVSQLVFLKV